MDVKELRSGNWINTNEFHVKELQGEHQYDPGWYRYVHMFTPIKLTEEWFVKLGFEDLKGEHAPLYIKNEFLIEDLTSIPVDFDFSFRIQIDSQHSRFLRNIEYVHQLQNLYFALTGEELILNK